MWVRGMRQCGGRGPHSSSTVLTRLPPLSPQGEPDPAEPIRVGDLGECLFPLSNTAVSSGPETLLCEMEAIAFNPVQSWLKQEGSQGEG